MTYYDQNGTGPHVRRSTGNALSWPRPVRQNRGRSTKSEPEAAGRKLRSAPRRAAAARRRASGRPQGASSEGRSGSKRGEGSAKIARKAADPATLAHDQKSAARNPAGGAADCQTRSGARPLRAERPSSPPAANGAKPPPAANRAKSPSGSKNQTSPAPSAAATPPASAAAPAASAQPPLPDVEALARNIALAIEQGGKALAAYLRPRESGEIKTTAADDIGEVVRSIGRVAEHYMADPQRAFQAQAALTRQFIDLWAFDITAPPGRTGAAHRPARRRRQALRRSGMARQSVFRLHQASLRADDATGRTIWSSTPMISIRTSATRRNSTCAR